MVRRLFFYPEPELKPIHLLKTIFETFAARKFHGFAGLDGNGFAGRRIASLAFGALAEFEFPDSGKLNAARFFEL